MRRSGLRSVPALPQSGFNASPPASRQVHAQLRACLSPLEEVDNALSAVGAGVAPSHPIHRIPLEEMVEAIRISIAGQASRGRLRSRRATVQIAAFPSDHKVRYPLAPANFFNR